MSDLELSPQETACRGRAGGRAWRAVEPVRELMDGRPVALGGPRAISVTRTLTSRARRMVGALRFVDYHLADDMSWSAGMQVAPHPHTGLQTVSWPVEGEWLHSDSLGGRQLVTRCPMSGPASPSALLRPVRDGWAMSPCSSCTPRMTRSCRSARLAGSSPPPATPDRSSRSTGRPRRQRTAPRAPRRRGSSRPGRRPTCLIRAPSPPSDPPGSVVVTDAGTRQVRPSITNGKRSQRTLAHIPI